MSWLGESNDMRSFCRMPIKTTCSAVWETGFAVQERVGVEVLLDKRTFRTYVPLH